MTDWPLYDVRLTITGRTQRERLLYQARRALQEQFMDSPATKQMQVGGHDISVMVSSGASYNEKSFVLMPGDLVKIGDILLWENIHWLVTEVDPDSEIACKGTIVQCNRLIRWQNPNTKEIVERWCLLTKPYTSNITDGSIISTSNREFKVQISYDEETKLVDLDKRFMLEIIDGQPRTYACTSVDQQTNVFQDLDSGFITWNLSQDESKHPGDNEELMICDYIPPDDGPTKGALIISGKSFVRAGLGERRYTVSTPDAGVVDGYTWTISVDDTYSQYIHYDVEDDAVNISADIEAIGAVVTLHVADTGSAYLAVEMDVEVVDAYG